MTQPPWWQSAVLYQIYPRSFQDSNGDGIGDLRGVLARLPYLVELGVDAIWLSPIYPSPMDDFGYDVADYTDIDPIFGTLADLDALISAAHGYGIKVLLDLVPNHTSNRHPWFIESRSSRENARRDWYIWHDPAPQGGPPNNWLSEFGGSAWQYDTLTAQYYYHAFLPSQPDLNWRNPDVRAAMYDVMRFWLRRGVDGFRVDVMWHLMKDPQFRDNPPNREFRPDRPAYQRLLPIYTTDVPEVHDVVREIRAVVDEFSGRVLIGEIYLPLAKLVAYYGRGLDGAHLPFNFALIETPWNARQIADLVAAYERLLPEGGWPNWVLGNHDRPRVATRVGEAQAAVAAMLLLTLRGTPTLYYGDEIGLTQAKIALADARDPLEKRVPGLGRDGARTPMPWDDELHAGFSTAQPWLPLNRGYSTRNVVQQREDHASLYHLYRRLIALRRASSALHSGSYHPIAATGDALLFVRVASGERMLVALNLGGNALTIGFAQAAVRGEVRVSSLRDRDGETVQGGFVLRPHEGLVIALAADATLPIVVREIA